MKNNTLLLILILFLVTLENTCANRDGEIILKKIVSSVKDGDRIMLSDFTDFEWNNVVICGTGTSLKDYEKFLGSVKIKEFTTVIIFRKNDTVVKFIKQDWHPENYSKVEFYFSENSYRYKIINKDEAIFEVKKIKNRAELKLVGSVA